MSSAIKKPAIYSFCCHTWRLKHSRSAKDQGHRALQASIDSCVFDSKLMLKRLPQSNSLFGQYGCAWQGTSIYLSIICERIVPVEMGSESHKAILLCLDICDMANAEDGSVRTRLLSTRRRRKKRIRTVLCKQVAGYTILIYTLDDLQLITLHLSSNSCCIWPLSSQAQHLPLQAISGLWGLPLLL